MSKFTKFVFCFIFIFVSYTITFAKDEIGLYGFYLGQDIEQVLNNAETKGFTDIHLAYSKHINANILEKLEKYKKVSNITPTYEILDLYQSPANFKKLNNKIFNESGLVNKFAFDIFFSKKFEKYIKDSIYLVIKMYVDDPNKNKPRINLEFIVDNLNNIATLSVISVEPHLANLRKDNIANINKVFLERFPNLDPIDKQLLTKMFGKNMVIASYLDDKSLFRIGFYDMETIGKYIDLYLKILNNVKDEDDKKATDGI